MCLHGLNIETWNQASQKDGKLDCINAEKDVLIHVQNPKAPRMKNQNPRTRGLHFLEEGKTQDLLPFYIMLGVTDYKQV